MKPPSIDTALIAALRKRGNRGNPPLASRLQREIGCSGTDLRAAISRLRMKGKLHFTRLELSASMMDDFTVSGAAACAAPDAPVPEFPSTGTGEGDAGGVRTPASPEAAMVAQGSGQEDSVGTEHADTPGDASEPLPEVDAAGKGDVPAASVATAQTPGPLLLRSIEIYCAATGTSETLIGATLFRHPGFVGLLRRRGTVTPEKSRAVEGLMAEYPNGVPSDMPSSAYPLTLAKVAEIADPPCAAQDVPTTPAVLGVADAVRREAEAASSRRLQAGRMSAAHPLTVAETIQSMVADSPADVVQAVTRTHRALWQRCLALGRLEGETPAAMLYLALGAGLDAIEADIAGRPARG